MVIRTTLEEQLALVDGLDHLRSLPLSPSLSLLPLLSFLASPSNPLPSPFPNSRKRKNSEDGESFA